MTIVKDKMGLDPNDADLFLQFENIDLDGSGDIDKEELFLWLKDQKAMHSEMFWDKAHFLIQKIEVFKYELKPYDIVI